MAIAMRDDDDWLGPTRALLEEWGAHQRSIRGQGLGYSSQAAHLSIPGEVSEAPIPENAVADQVDRILCQVRDANAGAYAVLYRYYYWECSIRYVAQDLRLTRTNCNNLKQAGEIMVHAWWSMRDRRRA